MAFRELTMIEVKEVLRRWQAAQGERQIARQTLVDRKTVHRYVQVARECGLPKDRTLTDEEVAQVARRVQARPAVSRSAPWQQLEPHAQRIRSWLEADKPLTLRKVHRLLRREGLSGSYDTLRRFAISELGWREARVTVALDDPPAGHEAQVDLGRMGMIQDEGRGRMLWALIVTLALSRYQFVWPLFRRTAEAIIEGLEHAWLFFPGMPRIMIPDNEVALVVAADPLQLRLSEAFTDYVQARGILVDAARVRRPKDKARVERQVPYVRADWFRGEEFTSLSEARESARIWCAETAGLRVHGTTRKRPREVYESVEQAEMRPAPAAVYDVPIFADAKVHADHHVQVACALYSVPYRYVGRTVHVRADRSLVKIYDRTELIKAHPRTAPGGRQTDPSDYPPGKSIYARRSIDELRHAARDRGEHIGRYAEQILESPLPWARMRSVYALLALCEKYGDGRVEAICQSALSFDVVDVGRIGRMLKRAVAPKPLSAGNVVAMPLAPTRFSRSPEQFQTRKEGGEG